MSVLRCGMKIVDVNALRSRMLTLLNSNRFSDAYRLMGEIEEAIAYNEYNRPRRVTRILQYPKCQCGIFIRSCPQYQSIIRHMK